MKKTMHKSIALLLAVLLLIGSIPFMSMSAFAQTDADDPMNELTAAIDTLADPENLYFYSDEAILLVAHTLGYDCSDPQAFLDDACTNNYRYNGDTTDEAAVRESAAAIRSLMPTITAMRDESKATVEMRIVPVKLNNALVNCTDDLRTLESGDRITFAVELETNYYVSAADLPIVYDCTKFCLVDNDDRVFSFDGAGADDAFDVRNADTPELINLDCLRAKIKNNYSLECYTADSPSSQYPAAYQTPEYMQQYKIMLLELLPKASKATIPQIMTGDYCRLCTFTLQVRDDVAFDGTQSLVGVPADWYATNEVRRTIFTVTRAAGMKKDGKTPALKGSSARYPFEVFDFQAQYGQTAGVRPAAVSFGADVPPHPPIGCTHAEFEEIERVEPTEYTDGYVKYRCLNIDCKYEWTEILYAPKSAALELSSHTVTTGSTVDVTVTMNNNPGIIALRFGLEYDPAVLQLTEVIDGGLLGENTIEYNPDFGKTPYWILWEDALANKDYQEDGTLVTFRFRVRDNAPLGTTLLKLNFRTGDAFNKDMEDRSFNTRDSQIDVKLRGDAFNDNELNVKDASCIRKYLVGSFSEENINMVGADFDRDGEVTLKDATLIKRYLAGWDNVA